MAISSIGNTLSTGFLARVTSASSSSSSSASSSSSSTPATFNATTLRVGAGTMAAGVQRLNVGIAYLQESKDTLSKLEKIVDKVIAIADRGARSGSSGQRINLNAEFRKLAGEFHKIVAESADKKNDSLDVEDITTVLTNLGLDPKKASTIAEFFNKFDYPASDKNLASDHVKGKRPLRIPTTEETTEVVVPGGGETSIVTGPSLDLGTSPSSEPLLADFDGDGIVDIFLKSNLMAGALFFKGNGDGSFAAAITASTTLNNTSASKIGDFNGDGKLDILLSHFDSFQVLLGNGDGTFEARPNEYFLDNSKSTQLAVGDLDGDGYQDFVMGSNTGAILTYFGNGDGTFSEPVSGSSRIGSGTLSIALGDVDGNPGLDLILTGEGKVDIRGNDGSGNLSTLYPLLTVNVDGNGNAIVGDINGDGKLDYITLRSTTGGFLGINIGNGDGTFADALTTHLNAYGMSFADIALGDVTGDGKADIVFAAGDSVFVLGGNGDGTFAAPVSYGFDGSTGSRYVQLADLNNDGLVDIFNYDGGTGGHTFTQEDSGSTVIVTTEEVSSRTPKEWDAVFASGRTLSSVGDAIALREDAKRLRQEIHKNISVLDEGLNVLEKNLGLVRETGLGILAVANSLDGDTTADRVARMVQQQVRQRGIRYFSELGNLNSISAAALLSSNSTSGSSS